MSKELKLFSTSAYDKKDAEALTQILFKLPSNIKITAIQEKVNKSEMPSL